MKKRWGKDGFSLVEVIIAMAVLAILTVPILAYFTRAATTTADGRDVQRATLAAESVAEELKGYASFSQLESLDGVEDWVIEGTVTTPAPGTVPEALKMTKKVEVDGRDFTAKVKVDYDYRADPAASATAAAQFNNFAEPQLKEVYSENNVVAVEKKNIPPGTEPPAPAQNPTEQTDMAISDFYYQLRNKGNTAVTRDQIKSAVKRKIQIDIGEADADVYSVGVAYEYTCSITGAENPYKTYLVSTKIEKSKLENIFLFYYLLEDVPEAEKYRQDIEISVSGGMTQEEAQKLCVYLVSQETDAAGKSKINIHVSAVSGSNANRIRYRTNGTTSLTGTGDFSGDSSSIVEKNVNGKRIAQITVDVYDGAATVFNEDTRLAQIQTSKGE